MKKNIKTILICFFGVAILTGCIATGTRMDYSQVNQIQRGVTTEQQIRMLFGEPVTVSVNQKAGIRKLTYGYRNSDQIKKSAAGIGGAAAGGLLGSQIGGGSGQVIAGSVGAIAGGLLADNMVTARQEEQYLEVLISLATGRVVDYNYIENKGRSQSWSVNSGVGTL
ncbi:glycine zipper 2TM domain-containing protein [Suttonella sp. R2A3]|uniref:glycine zipper 2TM domain-containing protein n=1 Tax=Suttonella sp. R2A3 TaxID=2908648 RepID=UPI001F2011EA|nr:glycine zipper 2TM domain-containing protein [Suttonella sp. R2A3]UJF24742.1 glycine zipper 2TM domain-containing protein [Suttonella sp. R2A3]